LTRRNHFAIHRKKAVGTVTMPQPRRTPRILNVLPSRNTEFDWRIEHADAAGVVAGPAEAIPAAVDLREAWWKIGDQGATGSCVGWATADSLLRWHFVKAKRIGRNDTLSVRFMWMASKETDEFIKAPTTFIDEAGTSLKAALDVARKFGAVRADLLPFGGGLYAGKQETFYAIAGRLKIAGYFNLSLNRGGSLDAWRRWIATNGPILTRLDVDATWDAAKAAKGNLDEYKPDTTRGGHAVALVGYTPDRFIVRNSWGTTQWGDKGFGYASLAYAQHAFTEAYGADA
jgi:Papain family cysteine protease